MYNIWTYKKNSFKLKCQFRFISFAVKIQQPCVFYVNHLTNHIIQFSYFVVHEYLSISYDWYDRLEIIHLASTKHKVRKIFRVKCIFLVINEIFIFFDVYILSLK